ncbi:MAG: hypothetical protein M3Z27_03725 [Actinomycetota bacterium]|nr:hypothetical protein [Actinomycetota bacterium]
MSEPLLLVDVDGVISLFGFDPTAPPAGRYEMVEGIAHLLSATAGDHLRALAEMFQLVWCTGWEEKAAEYLPRALGLPEIPHLSFDRNPGHASAHWKLAAIDAYAGADRPLAWVDDAHDERCHRWAQERPGPSLLLSTDPAVGLTAGHVEELLQWAHSLCPAAA